MQMRANMKNHKRIKKIGMTISAVLAGGAVFDNGCFNTLASINVCGTLLTFCTPADQINALFPYLTIPDFGTDPSCTVPFGCGTGDIYTDIPVGFPGGGAPDQPQDDQGGGLGGGGGGGN
ncbi:hypothetical protein B7486_06755 [cyanobacterium TDX16]|nr:hypothetical protein B7486_06755 [cyanobacterium TDX16]